MSEVFPEARSAGRSATIATAPLDHFIHSEAIEGRSLLKIDVQGFELDCLKGCDLLLDQIDHIYVECSYIELYTGQALIHEIVALLLERSFRLLGEFNTVINPDIGNIQSDCLFVRVDT